MISEVAEGYVEWAAGAKSLAPCMFRNMLVFGTLAFPAAPLRDQTLSRSWRKQILVRFWGHSQFKRNVLLGPMPVAEDLACTSIV